MVARSQLHRLDCCVATKGRERSSVSVPQRVEDLGRVTKLGDETQNRYSVGIQVNGNAYLS